MPAIGRVLAGRRLGRIEQAQRPGAELHQLRHAAGHHILMRREQILHGFGADAPFHRAVDIGIEFFRGETRAFVERQMQAEQAPGGVLEGVEFFQERRRQLFAPDQILEGLVHVERRGDELARPHGAAVVEFDAGGLAVLDDDFVDAHLRLVAAAGGDEGLHQPARQIERAALAELVAAFQIEGADHRAHRRGLRQRVDQPGAEQRHLEQEQQPHVLVLEQFAHHIERLAVGDLEEFAPQRGAIEQRLALVLRQRFGIALGQENLARDLLGLAVPFAEGGGVFLGEARDIGDRLFQIAPEHQRRAVAMRLAEFVARRDVAHARVEPEVLEPRRLADVEMIDRMQVVVEAGQGHFAGAQAAAIGQPPLHQQDVETGPGEIAAEDQPVVAGADDDAVIGFFQRF